MKKLLLSSWLMLFSCMLAVGQQKGDTVLVKNVKYIISSDNLISNPGFENGFTGWTDGTSLASTLSSAYFTINTSGGVDNSKYLVGTTNTGVGTTGAIGTGWKIDAGKTYYFSYNVKYQSASYVATPEVWLKVSLTNDKLNVAEPFKVIDTTLVNSGGVWTRNTITFTNSNAYAFIVARFRWLNNRFGFDNFALHEAYQMPRTEILKSTINSAQLIYDVTKKGATEFLNAIETAQNFIPSTSSVDVDNAIVNLEKAINKYKYTNASAETPLDMTGYIVNPGFDNNDATGWNGAGTVNYHEVEFYQKTFDMYQQISGLPSGKYRLKAKGFERPKLNDAGAAYKAGTETIYARFYASASDFSELNAAFPSLYKHIYTGTGSSNGYVNTMASAETLISNKIVSYYDATVNDILLDEGGKLTIGAKSDFQQSGYWALFDQYKLEYLGAYDVNDLFKAINNRIAEAQSMKSKQIQQSAINAIDHAIAVAQPALTADSLIFNDLAAVKDTIDSAIQIAEISVSAYQNLNKTIEDARIILGFLEKADEITKLQTAIDAALVSYGNKDLTLTQINQAATTLKAVYKSVGKQIYVPGWMMGDVYNPANNWSIERSKQSKNWILFWEPGFGANPGTTVDECLALAEKSFNVYADSLKFINKGSSKTDKYKMVIRLRFSTEWEASGSGVDNTIGLLTLTPWALSSRGGQTIAHEVGHCFQYQTHCDNNDQNGWTYGFGSGASGGNGWWEQCAQWQAYQVFPSQQFTSEWFTGYMNNVHKHIIHEAPRYENYFIQDYWVDLHGKDIIGKLWNKSIKPEDPVEAYKRLTMITQSQFNDEMYTCAAKFASWDINAIRANGASKITSRPQPKMKNMGDNYWMIDSTVCIENYGHNIIKLNAPTTAKTVTVSFEGKAGAIGYRKNYQTYAGWRFGFVAMKYDGTRVYGDMQTAAMNVNEGKAIVSFDCPANCSRLWLIVTGAPSLHWRHAWDDNDTNDEQWPYQVKFNNTNLLGYANVINAVPDIEDSGIKISVVGNELKINEIPDQSLISIFNMQGACVLNDFARDAEHSTVLNKGLYIVTIKTVQGTFSRKISVF